MAKPKKPVAPAPSKKTSSPSTDARWHFVLHAMIFIIFASGIIALFRISQIYVDRRLAFPTRPPKVVLANRPVWMSDSLADEIIKLAQPIGLHSAFDHQLLVDTAIALKSNPWIKQVNQVRRAYGEMPGDTLEIDCQYRSPAALVKWGQYYWLVDGDGVKLPEQYTLPELPKIMLGDDGKINVRIIDGVAHAPTESGQIWPGDDLAGGLEMAKVLSGQEWAEEIRDIDVSNFGGRKDDREAQIVLVTRYGTQVRWGRPPSAKDAFVEAAASTKLAELEDIFQRDKRVDANEPWIDLRFDRVTCPGPTQDATAGLDTQSGTGR